MERRPSQQLQWHGALFVVVSQWSMEWNDNAYWRPFKAIFEKRHVCLLIIKKISYLLVLIICSLKPPASTVLGNLDVHYTHNNIIKNIFYLFF